MQQINRRAILAGLMSTVAMGAFAEAPITSLRPLARGTKEAKRAFSIKERVLASGLSGDVSVEVRDVSTGQIVGSYNGGKKLPPASVMKSLTALYAMNTLGTSGVFATRLNVDGNVKDGILKGDVYLIGGGSPSLDTDDLLRLATNLKAAGITRVTGRFYVVDTALPKIASIDAGQPDHVGYNPSISGLNLNYNRVYFGWKRAGNGYQTTMEARASKASPQITQIKMKIADRKMPVYGYGKRAGRDTWTVAKAALGSGGSRWLPVRQPALYAGETFQKLCHSVGVSIPTARHSQSAKGREVARRNSRTVGSLSRTMLKYSTNLTAEVLGLQTSQKRGAKPKSLAASANSKATWIGKRYGIKKPTLVDHSGLGSKSQISAKDMTHVLVSDGWDGALRPVLKTIALRNSKGGVIRRNDVQIVAKTGTLNFVSALSGFVKTSSGRQLAFTFFSADMKQRDRIKKQDRERPKGGKVWARRSRNLQQALLRDWADL